LAALFTLLFGDVTLANREHGRNESRGRQPDQTSHCCTGQQSGLPMLLHILSNHCVERLALQS
jgi:hypothetical protein